MQRELSFGSGLSFLKIGAFPGWRSLAPSGMLERSFTETSQSSSGQWWRAGGVVSKSMPV